MLKRAYLSITRRKSKSILLFIILFVVANLIITTIAIKNATNESTEFAKNSIGSEVTLSVDMQGLRQNFKGSTSTTSQAMEVPKISKASVLNIAESKYISGYSYGFTSYADVVDLEAVESEMEKMGEMSIEDVPSFKENFGDGGSRGQMPNMGDMKFDMNDIRDNLVSGDVTLNATNSFSSLSEVKSGTMELVSGESTAIDKDNTVIISYDFAELNELKVGSKIKLVNTETEENVELEVVGIYENSESNTGMRNMLMNSANTMYVNLTTGEQFMTKEEYNEGDYGISSCIYYLNDPEDYEAFVAEAETKVNLTENNLKLSIDESTYKRMVGSIESIGNFADIILIVVVIASVLLVTLIINSQTKERNYEMGVLLSLGEKKSKIVGQIAVELIIVATIAFLISTLTGGLISGIIGDNLSVSQENLREEQQMVGRGGMKNSMQQAESIEIDVSVGVVECLILFGVGYLIVLFAMIFPAINIFRYDPKTILTRRD